MPRFAKMLAEGMKDRGHKIQIWSPTDAFSKNFKTSFFRKWFGYVDQYIIFPRQIKKKLKAVKTDTLFVFTDHALGPWIPLIANKPHVIHCHDFLAQKSAVNEIKENQTSWTGKQYQNLIRKGYSEGENFISVSNKTKEDLHRFLNKEPAISEVVYNGLNRDFKPGDKQIARLKLGKYLKMDLSSGFLLHVGGNQWYKNRKGVLKIYSEWRNISLNELPLLCIGEKPDDALQQVYHQSKYRSDVHFFSGVNDMMLMEAYTGSTAFLFPSLDEGFGWPIAEAMASGTPVITTNKEPMTEVTGNSGIHVERMPYNFEDQTAWAQESAKLLEELLNYPEEIEKQIIESQLRSTARFEKNKALNDIEIIYKKVLEEYKTR